ncbi:hypothetical protein F3H15_36375, partial [Pseudomonas aeruginosa]
LWNILYDGVLRLELGDGAQLIGFADDLALVVSAKKEAELMAITNVALQKISAWMKQKRLHLAPEKTEAIVLSGRRKLSEICFTLQGVRVVPTDKLKYLGFWFDKSLKFGKHIEETT